MLNFFIQNISFTTFKPPKNIPTVTLIQGLEDLRVTRKPQIKNELAYDSDNIVNLRFKVYECLRFGRKSLFKPDYLHI